MRGSTMRRRHGRSALRRITPGLSHSADGCTRIACRRGPRVVPCRVGQPAVRETRRQRLRSHRVCSTRACRPDSLDCGRLLGHPAGRAGRRGRVRRRVLPVVRQMMGIWYEAMMRWVGPVSTVTALAQSVVRHRGEVHGVDRRGEPLRAHRRDGTAAAVRLNGARRPAVATKGAETIPISRQTAGVVPPAVAAPTRNPTDKEATT